MPEGLTSAQLTQDMIGLGIQTGDQILLFTSLSGIGWIDGGPETVIRAVQDAIGETGSLFVMTNTHSYKLPLSNKNVALIFDRNTPTYTGSTNNYFLQMPGTIRTSHPTVSFAGVGASAAKILDGHGPDTPAYDPVHKLALLPNSKKLLLGNPMRFPTVHVAQNLLRLSNRTLGKYGVNYRSADGTIKLFRRNYVGGCSRGFLKFYDIYTERGALTEGKVGEGKAWMADLGKCLEIDMEILSDNPAFFLCDDPYCYSCRVTWDFSDTSYLRYKLRTLYKRLKGN